MSKSAEYAATAAAAREEGERLDAELMKGSGANTFSPVR